MRLTRLFLTVFALSFRVYAASCTPGSPNLVANCGFETGDLSGWTLSGHDSDPGYNGIDWGVDLADAHSGSYGAYLGGFGGVLDLDQSIATTPGMSYTVSFWLAQSPTPVAPYLNSFSFDFGSSTLLSLTQVTSRAFTEYSFTAGVLTPLTTLSFGVRDDIGFFSIDDISVTPVAVPEPAMGMPAMLAGLLLALARLSKDLAHSSPGDHRVFFLRANDTCDRIP